MTNPLGNVCEKLTHVYKVVNTWWCWHIYKGEEVGVDVDQLGEETPSAECPPIEYGQSDGATGALHRKDRVSLGAPDRGWRCPQGSTPSPVSPPLLRLF